jgi:hypothetical protein
MKSKLLLCLALVLSGNCYAAIVYPKAPDGGRQIVYEHLNPKFLGGVQIEELTIGNPYQDYSVGLTNLVSGRLLSETKAGHWMYLLIHGTNTVGMQELIADDKTLKLAGFYEADFSDETLEALRIAEQLPQIKKQDYEIRRLDIMPIQFVAVWLHGKSDDIIIPLGATFGRWNALQPYSESQMIKLLKPEAIKRLKTPGFDL